MTNEQITSLVRHRVRNNCIQSTATCWKDDFILREYQSMSFYPYYMEIKKARVMVYPVGQGSAGLDLTQAIRPRGRHDRRTADHVNDAILTHNRRLRNRRIR